MCTDLLVVSKTKDGQALVVDARSQEFNERVGYRVMLRRQGEMVRVTMPAKKASLTEALTQPAVYDLCISQYDYTGAMMTSLTDDGEKPVSTAVFDGMNSAGLAAGS